MLKINHVRTLCGPIPAHFLVHSLGIPISMGPECLEGSTMDHLLKLEEHKDFFLF